MAEFSGVERSLHLEASLIDELPNGAINITTKRTTVFLHRVFTSWAKKWGFSAFQEQQEGEVQI